MDHGVDALVPGERRSSRSRDARARRTRQRLVSAYVQLSGPDDELPSVADIVRLAGVNRSSFYAHFDDLGDLGVYVLESALDDIDAGQVATMHQQNPQELRTASASMIVSAVADNAATLRAAVRHNRALLRRQLGSAIERWMTEILRILPGWERADTEPLVLLVIYLSHGWAGTLCAWLAGDIAASQDELVEELLALNPDGARFLSVATTPQRRADSRPTSDPQVPR